jgi:hypothetical protein
MALQPDDHQAAVLLAALGLPADTDDPDLVVATVADLAAQAAGINTEKSSTIAAAARKAGLEVIDTDSLTALEHDAQEVAESPPRPPRRRSRPPQTTR